MAQTRGRQLIAEHFRSIAHHLRALAVGYMRGNVDDEEVVNRLGSLADMADAYGRYHGREHPAPADDPVLRHRASTFAALAGFERNHRGRRRRHRAAQPPVEVKA